MIRLGFEFQLKNEYDQTDMHRYEKTISNRDVMQILEAAERDCTFEDMLEEGIDCICQVREEIEEGILKGANRRKLFEDYGTENIFEAYELLVDFDEMFYRK